VLVPIMAYQRIVTFGAAGAVVLAVVLTSRAQEAGSGAEQFYRQAQDLARDKKLDEALAAVKKAVRLAPGNDLYRATASDYELQLGRYADGVADALAAVRLNDKVGAYYVLVAANAVGDQDLDRAREYSERVLKGGAKEFGAGPVADAHRLHDLVTPRTYTLFWELDPKKAVLTNGLAAVALPKADLPYQSVSYEISGVRSQRLVKGEVNDVLLVVPRGDKIKLTTKVTVKPYSYKAKLDTAPARGPLPAEARSCLGPCETIDPRSPVLRKIVSGLKAAGPVDTARNILGWMKTNVEYKLETTKIGKLDFTSVDELVERGHAECKGYTMLFVGLCRAAGVPARSVWGLTRVAPGQDRRFGDIASHNWAEVYVSGVGWVPVDPQHPETLGFLPTNDIRIFMDVTRSKTSGELLPMINLVGMNGDKLRFEEAAR
jgi:hypothetical protein